MVDFESKIFEIVFAEISPLLYGMVLSISLVAHLYVVANDVNMYVEGIEEVLVGDDVVHDFDDSGEERIPLPMFD